MRKRVRADDGFIGLNDHPRDLADQPTGLGNFFRANLRPGIIKILAGPQPHHDFFHRRIARPFADAVDGTFHLPGPGVDGRHGIGDRQIPDHCDNGRR